MYKEAPIPATEVKKAVFIPPNNLGTLISILLESKDINEILIPIKVPNTPIVDAKLGNLLFFLSTSFVYLNIK